MVIKAFTRRWSTATRDFDTGDSVYISATCGTKSLAENEWIPNYCFSTDHCKHHILLHDFDTNDDPIYLKCSKGDVFSEIKREKGFLYGLVDNKYGWICESLIGPIRTFSELHPMRRNDIVEIIRERICFDVQCSRQCRYFICFFMSPEELYKTLRLSRDDIIEYVISMFCSVNDLDEKVRTLLLSSTNLAIQVMDMEFFISARNNSSLVTSRFNKIKKVSTTNTR